MGTFNNLYSRKKPNMRYIVKTHFHASLFTEYLLPKSGLYPYHSLFLVVALPKAPQNLSVVYITAHTATLTWIAPDTSMIPISGYQVLYTPDLQKPWKVVSNEAS